MLDNPIKFFIEKDISERRAFISAMSDVLQRDNLIERLAESEEVPLQTLQELPAPLNFKALEIAAKSNKSITLRPTDKGRDGVKYLKPARAKDFGKPQHGLIDRQKTVGSQIGVSLLVQFGPMAEISTNRGRLEQVMPESIEQEVSPFAPPPPSVPVEQMKALEEELEATKRKASSEKGQATKAKNALAEAEAENQTLRQQQQAAEERAAALEARLAALEAQNAQTTPVTPDTTE